MGMERRIVTALSLLSELFEELLGAELNDFDDVDREVLISQADDAGRHLTNALFLHRPDLRKLPPERRVPHIDRLFARYPCEVDSDDIGSLAIRAYDEIAELLDVRSVAIRREADFAMSHLDVVLLLLDPEMYGRAIEGASADDRIRIAARAEQVELMLDEARALVREDAL
jgi:hypothetical protein